MLREPMRRTQIARRLTDLGLWSLVLGAGIFVGTWWAEHGRAVVGRLAAWSSSAPDLSRPPEPAKLGTRKRTHLDRIKKTGSTDE
jgi:hypothetical protein